MTVRDPHSLLSVSLLSAALLASAANAQSGNAAPTLQSGEAAVNDVKAKVEALYLVAPNAAQTLGTTIGWQTRIALPTGLRATRVWSAADGVFVGNTRNELTMLRPDTGTVVWFASGAPMSDSIIAVKPIAVPFAQSHVQRIAVATNASVYLASPIDGTLHSPVPITVKQPVRRTPSTSPVATSNAFIWGTRTGIVCWHRFATGAEVNAKTIGASIVAKPTLYADTCVLVGTTDGYVAALDAATGASYWRTKLGMGVCAPIAAANGTAIVASQDQYIYAFDIQSGAKLWSYFTESSLETPPFATDEVAIQFVPTEGLVCFELRGEGHPGGIKRWTKQGLGLPVLTAHDQDLFLWDPIRRQVVIVDLATGAIAKTIALPQVEWIEADQILKGDFMVWNSDGRVEYLAPRVSTAPKAPAPAAAANASN